MNVKKKQKKRRKKDKKKLEKLKKKQKKRRNKEKKKLEKRKRKEKKRRKKEKKNLKKRKKKKKKGGKKGGKKAKKGGKKKKKGGKKPKKAKKGGKKNKKGGKKKRTKKGGKKGKGKGSKTKKTKENIQGGGSGNGPTCTCSGHGDPHYRYKCDGNPQLRLRFDYQGKCSYVTAEPCGDKWAQNKEGLPYFRIEETHKPARNPRAALTESLTIKLDTDDDGKADVEVFFDEIKKGQRGHGDATVTRIDANGEVKVAGDDEDENPKVLSYGKWSERYEDPSKKFTISFGGVWLNLETSFGLKVSWNSKYKWDIDIPTKYRQKLCGMCGIFDKPKDQITKRYENRNGNEWQIDGSCAPGYGKEPKAPVDMCEGLSKKDKTKATNMCGVITKKTGPFGKCGGGDGLYENCVQDVCASLSEKGDKKQVEKDTKKMYCRTLGKRAESCGRKADPKWRTKTQCKSTRQCHANASLRRDPCNQRYQRCRYGKTEAAIRKKVKSCRAKRAKRGRRRSRQNCVCNEGFYKKGKECVKFEQCNKKTSCRGGYKAGESFYRSCRSKCTCQAKTFKVKCKKMDGASRKRCVAKRKKLIANRRVRWKRTRGGSKKRGKGGKKKGTKKSKKGKSKKAKKGKSKKAKKYKKKTKKQKKGKKKAKKPKSKKSKKKKSKKAKKTKKTKPAKKKAKKSKSRPKKKKQTKKKAKKPKSKPKKKKTKPKKKSKGKKKGGKKKGGRKGRKKKGRRKN